MKRKRLHDFLTGQFIFADKKNYSVAPTESPVWNLSFGLLSGAPLTDIHTEVSSFGGQPGIDAELPEPKGLLRTAETVRPVPSRKATENRLQSNSKFFEESIPRAPFIREEYRNPTSGRENIGYNLNSSPAKRHFHQAGNATGKTEISDDFGQVVWITIYNANALPTTVSVSERAGGYSQQTNLYQARHLLPFGSSEFTFSKFGSEPMGRSFTIDSISDAFIINYKIESTWVPGMPSNR